MLNEKKDKSSPALGLLFTFPATTQDIKTTKNGFKYSDALVNYKKAWSKEELFKFLEKPKDYIKGTKMIYKGLKKSTDRADLISYLESLK